MGTQPTQIRYYLHPGKVRSISDGEIHYIGVGQLARLYNLSLRSPNVIVQNDMYREDYLGYTFRNGDIHLYPRERGDYQKFLKSQLKRYQP